MAEEASLAKKRVRSTSYPAYGLEKAITNIEQLESNLGRGPFSRESAAKALGYSGVSGTSGKAVAALVHYGLLTRSGDTYEVSELTDRIVRWSDQVERRNAISEAAKAPKLFRQLFESYVSKSVPSMLAHILAREHKIGGNVADEVVKIFTETMTYSEHLKNGVLVELKLDDAPVVAEFSDGEKAQEAESEKTVVQQPERNSPSSANVNMQRMDIVPGLTLLYDSTIAFELFTNADFVTALQALKTQAEAKRSGSS